jgi:hypothetical protein
VRVGVTVTVGMTLALVFVAVRLRAGIAINAPMTKKTGAITARGSSSRPTSASRSCRARSSGTTRKRPCSRWRI